MEVLKTIHTRQSVRNYKSAPVSQELLDQILEAAICAPSGKNKKPWKFKVITDASIMESIALKTTYCRWLKTAPCCISVFLDKEKSYDYLKDVQSCGAVMQNILLATHGLGLGGCWIGEVLRFQDEIMHMLQISQEIYELMGMIVIGYTDTEPAPKIYSRIDAFLL